MNWKSVVILLLFGPCLWAQNGAYVRKHGDQLALGNRYIERVISVAPGNVGTVKIVNKLSGRPYAVKDDVFALNVVFTGLGPAPGAEQNGDNDVLLTAKNCRFTGCRESDLNDGGKQVTLKFSFDWQMTAFRLEVNYAIDSSRFSLRKWIALSDSSNGGQFLDRMCVESMTLAGERCSGGQFGQPVLCNDIFLGVEYPTVENQVRDDSIRIGYVVGQEIRKEPYVSHASIVGSGPSGSRLEDTFMQYVDGIKVAGTRPCLLYNSWYDLRNPAIVQDSVGVMTEESVVNTVTAFREQLFDRRHIALDAFVLDDAWDNYSSAWEIDSARFPHGFAPIANALGSMHTGLGLWASPFCGYSNRDRRVAWGAANGYERSGDYLCFAGRKYKTAFQRAMDGYAREYALGYFKWDGFLLSCNSVDHGHLPGLYSREANVAAFIDIMKSVRDINPKVYLNITSGTWLSPWWLKYADCIWMQGEDYGYQESVPAMTDRHKAITYKDAVLWGAYRKSRLLFPMSSLMTHGIIKGRFNPLGGANESQESFRDDVMMYFGRGVMMWELYISPDQLSADDWDAIASSVKWAKANLSALHNTTMVLGNPLAREAYGYLHLSPEKGILLLRNPNAAAQRIQLPLTAQCGDLDPRMTYFVKVIYPYNRILPKPVKANDSVVLDLGGYEVLAAELIPAPSLDRGLPLGVKYRIEGGRPVVFGKPGEKFRIESVGRKSLGVVTFGGVPGRVICTLKSQDVKRVGAWSSHVNADVPGNYSHVKLALLLESGQQERNPGQPEFRITVNGTAAKPSVEGGDGSWFWVLADIAAGHNSIDCSVGFKNKAGGKVSVWIVGDQELARHTLEGDAVAGDDLLPAKPFPASIQKEYIPVAQYRVH